MAGCALVPFEAFRDAESYYLLFADGAPPQPISHSARHDSEGLSQAYEDRVVPFELGAVQVLEDRNDSFDREPGALENA